jgi:hypothetical protein
VISGLIKRLSWFNPRGSGANPCSRQAGQASLRRSELIGETAVRVPMFLQRGLWGVFGIFWVFMGEDVVYGQRAKPARSRDHENIRGLSQLFPGDRSIRWGVGRELSIGNPRS